MAETQIKAVIFDLYGVLALNGWQAFKAKHFTDRPEVWDQVFAIGRKVDAAQASYDDLVQFTAQQAGESTETVRYQLEHTSVNDELLAYVASHIRPWYSVGMLSNAHRAEVISQIFTPEQEDLFDQILLSHNTGLVKPDVRMYHTIADRLGVQPAECVFIDDQERHVLGAQSAGMQAVVYQNVPQIRAELEGLLG